MLTTFCTKVGNMIAYPCLCFSFCRAKAKPRAIVFCGLSARVLFFGGAIAAYFLRMLRARTFVRFIRLRYGISSVSLI